MNLNQICMIISGINLILVVALIIYIIVKSIINLTKSSFENKSTLKDSFGDITYSFTTNNGDAATNLLTTTNDGNMDSLPISQLTNYLTDLDTRITSVKTLSDNFSKYVFVGTDGTLYLGDGTHDINIQGTTQGEGYIYIGANVYVYSEKEDPTDSSKDPTGMWLEPVLYSDNLFMQASYMGDTKTTHCKNGVGLCGNSTKNYSNAYSTGGSFVYSTGGGNTLGLGPNNSGVGSDSSGGGSNLANGDKPSIHYAFRLMKPPAGTAGYLTNSDGYGYINNNKNKGGWVT